MSKMNIEKFMEYKDQFVELPQELLEFARQVEEKRKVNMEKIIKTNWRATRTKPDWLANRDKNINADDKLIGEMRGIFNKINDTNYETMVDSLFDLNIANQYQLSNLVTILLHKILFEEYNHDVYIYVYQKLVQMYIVDDDKKLYFRGIFLEESQKLFRESIATSYSDNSMIKDKRAAINFIRYIGLLYQHGLLTEQIANGCIMDLFFAIKKGNHVLIDALTSFLEVIMPKLDNKLAINIKNNLTKLKSKVGLEKRYQFKLIDTITLFNEKFANV